MNKELFISDIRPGESFIDYFLVRGKILGTGRNGMKYLSLTLVDRSGEVDAKVWDNVDSYSGLFEIGDIVMISAEATTYQGQLQLKVKKLQRADQGVFDLAQFVPSSVVPPETMLAQFQELLAAQVKDPSLKLLVDAFFADASLVRRFMSAPGGKAVHHAYRGGLLEHTLSMARMACLVCDHYGDQVSRDLLLTGVLFHDVGKVDELDGDAAYEYTTEGRLLGHLVIGIQIVDRIARNLPEASSSSVLLLKHLIASHHGVVEFGALKEPATVEATVLSHLDDLDARMQSFASIFRSMGEGEQWSGFQKLYNRHLYNWRNQAAAPTGGAPAPAPAPASAPASAPTRTSPAAERPRGMSQEERAGKERPLTGKLELPPGLFETTKRRSDS